MLDSNPKRLKPRFWIVLVVCLLASVGTSWAQTDLSLTKTASDTNPPIGSTITYTITVSNSGPQNANQITVSDLLPAGVTYVGSSPSVGVYDPVLGVWVIGLVKRNTSETLTIDVTVDDHSVGITNTAEIASSNKIDPDSTPGNNNPGEDDQGSVTVTAYPVVDLSVTKTVDEPAPDQGDTITFSLSVTNDGPSDGTGISVSDVLPDSLTFSSYTAGDATDTYDSGSGIWDVGDLAFGETATLEISAVVDALITPMTNVAEVATSDQNDPDSTPENNASGEDDYAEAAVTPTGSTGGGGGGIESDGSAAQVLAQVMFQRRFNAQETGVSTATDPTQFIGRGGVSSQVVQTGAGGATFSAGLVDVIPLSGPAQSIPLEVSPEDLIPVTNAEDIVAVDYIRPDGRRIGAMYTALTADGSIYEHTKVICDRLKGATLDRVETVFVKGHPFVMAKLIHVDGSIDYAVSGIAYETTDAFVLDSRFRLDEYSVPENTPSVINLQAWSVSREYTISLITESLNQLEAAKRVTYLNDSENAPELPEVYVRNSTYSEGKLHIELYNHGGTRSLSLTSANLGRTERSPRELFEHTVAVPEPNDQHISDVIVEVGPLFDVAFFVQPTDHSFMDQVYVADGSWGFAYDTEEENNAHIDNFEVLAQKAESLRKDGFRSVERSVRIAGKVRTWATAFRYLRPGGQPVDLSEFSYLEFDAWGKGQMRILLEKESISTSDHFGAVLKLGENPQSHRIWFEDFRLGDGTGRIDPSDIVLVSFYLIGPQGREQEVDVSIENLRFGGGEGDILALVPERAELKPNYPNPFSDVTTITYGVAENSDVLLTVHDMLGRTVATLVNERVSEGRYEVHFDAGDLASGVYLYRLRAGDTVETRSMSVIR